MRNIALLALLAGCSRSHGDSVVDDASAIEPEDGGALPFDSGDPGEDATILPPLDSGQPDAGSDGGGPRVSAICNADGWCWDAPGLQGLELNGVWAIATDNVWAVGEHGTILHWDGLVWSRVDSGTDVHLESVHGRRADEVFAVGHRDTILRWDGSAWREEHSEPPPDGGFYGVLTDVFVDEDGDTWAIGSRGRIFRRGSGTWRVVETRPGAELRLESVWGFGSDEVWVVGSSVGRPTPGVILRWNGTEWREDTVENGLLNLGADGAGSILAVGYGASVYRRDGDAWRRVSVEGMGIDASTQFNAAWAASSSEAWIASGYGDTITRMLALRDEVFQYDYSSATFAMRSISGAAPIDAWAVGFSGSLLHFDGLVWSHFPSSSAAIRDGIPVRFGDATDLWGASGDDLWVTVGVSRAGYMHWDGEQWSWVTGEGDSYAAGFLMNQVWGTATDDVWAVGDRRIQHWDGSAWRNVGITGSVPITDLQLYGVWGSGHDDVWAVGSRWSRSPGIVVRWNGAEWISSERVEVNSLSDVWGSAANDVWLAGTPALLHWDGTDYRAWEFESTRPVFRSVSGVAADRVWAVARDGVWSFDGTQWSEVYRPTTPYELTRIWAENEASVWAISREYVHHWNGAEWRTLTTGTDMRLTSVFGIDGVVRVTGERGAVLRLAR